MLSLISSTPSLRRFISAPLAHWAVVVWRPFRASHVNCIPQWGHRGWGRFPSSKIKMVSLTCLWNKFTLSAILVAARPLHPSTGHSCGPAAVGNEIQYVCGSPSGEGLPLMSPSRIHYMLSLLMHCQRPLHQVRTTVRALQPYPLSVPVDDSLPSHPPLVRCF